MASMRFLFYCTLNIGSIEYFSTEVLLCTRYRLVLHTFELIFRLTVPITTGQFIKTIESEPMENHISRNNNDTHSVEYQAFTSASTEIMPPHSLPIPSIRWFCHLLSSVRERKWFPFFIKWNPWFLRNAHSFPIQMNGHVIISIIYLCGSAFLRFRSLLVLTLSLLCFWPFHVRAHTLSVGLVHISIKTSTA